VKKGRIRNIIGKVNDMGTINDLLYNYQDTNEFVCSDGRMSVNGICQVEQPVDSVDTSKITKEIIETSKDGKDDWEKNKEWEEKVKRDKVLKDLEGTSDYYPELGKEKRKFEWNFDKEKKMDGYKNTVNNNIAAYNGWIEENLGIPSGVQNAVRVGGSVAALTGGTGVLAAVAPWAIPFLAGGAINKAETERIQNITDQDKQGDINTIDMMTYNAPQPGDDGFNIHRDKPDFRGTNQDQGVTSDAGFDQSSSGGYQQSKGSHHF
jgi:hypothetical protein